VHLIDDIYLVATLVGLESSTFYKFTDIVDSSVRCCIYLDYVEHRSLIKSYTIRTLVAWISIL
jgi:hypothetical protein